MNALTPCLAPIGGDRAYAPIAPLDDAIADDIAEIAHDRATLAACLDAITKRRERVRLQYPQHAEAWAALLADLDGLLTGLDGDCEGLWDLNGRLGGGV